MLEEKGDPILEQAKAFIAKFKKEKARRNQRNAENRYYERHPEKMREKNAKHYKNNSQKIRDRVYDYYWNHRDEILRKRKKKKLKKEIAFYQNMIRSLFNESMGTKAFRQGSQD